MLGLQGHSHSDECVGLGLLCHRLLSHSVQATLVGDVRLASSVQKSPHSWVWWFAPIVPATWEAEAGGSLEPGVPGFSEQSSQHCTPAWVTK